MYSNTMAAFARIFVAKNSQKSQTRDALIETFEPNRSKLLTECIHLIGFILTKFFHVLFGSFSLMTENLF